MTDQTIAVSAGAVEYTYPRTITALTAANSSPADISADVVLVSLGGYSTPGVWVAPDLITRPTPASVAVQLLIGGALRPAPGQYWLYVRITDSPEVVPRRTPGRITIT